MLRHYVVLAVKVLLRRKFFTFISLFGISFTLLVLMVATALLDHTFAPMPPETRQDRTLTVTRAVMYGAGSESTSDPGFRLLDRYARDLPGVERLSLYTDSQEVSSYVEGRRVQLWLKRTDGEFWRILDFTFLEGRPYTAEEVDQAALVAVVNRATRETFFGGEEAVGRTIEADGQRFRVIGVVENVSWLRDIPAADIWAPYTTLKTDAYRTGLLGSFQAMALGSSPDVLPQIRESFNSRLASVDPAEFRNPEAFMTIVAPFETAFEAYARNFPSFVDTRNPEAQGWRLALLLGAVGALFVLLPTVNLVNINVSRILERSSEIGVRKAFGASRRVLVGQFVVENVVLTLVGGAIGLVLSAFVLRAINESGLIRYADLAVNLRVFGYGLLLALVFGLVSGVYPAWRMSRLHPVEALRGGAR